MNPSYAQPSHNPKGSAADQRRGTSSQNSNLENPQKQTLVGAPTVDNIYPKPMSPPRLVNDFAQVMDASQLSTLENKLLNYNNTSSIEISIVTIDTLFGHDVSAYSFELANQWGIGKKGKNNGVLILASIKDRKMFIATGYGMEGVLPDAICAQIYRNEMVPAFKLQNYYQGFSKAADAIILVSKGEYTADEAYSSSDSGIPIGLIIIIIFIAIFVLAAIFGKGGRGGGGPYIGGGGWSSGSSSSWGSGSSWSGGSSGSFGGFGGGSFGGGGAGGSW